MKTIETWLPIFPGFYNTIFEPDETSEIDYINSERSNNGLIELEYNSFKFDYDTYESEVAESCCNFIESELSNFISGVKYQRVCSPKEYNFINDSVNIEARLSEKNIRDIKRYLKKNVDNFEKYLKNNYTSYDGFMSHYSNNLNDWLFNIDLCLADDHKLGAILQFILLNENKDYDNLVEAMYYYCEAYLGVSNYEECTEKEFCTECKEFVDPKGCIGNVCKECYEIGIFNGDHVVCSKCKNELSGAWDKRQYQYQLKHGLITPYDIVCNDCACVLS